MILVVGATGIAGEQICHKLIERGQAVRALVRKTADPVKVQALRDLGVEIMTGDLRDKASLGPACMGAKAVITTASAMPFRYEAGVNDLHTTDLQGTLALLEAARSAKVGHFIYTSFSGGIDIDCPLVRTKRTVEKAIEESGLRYTILRPSFFMDVWLSPATGFDYANGKATIYGTGDHAISWISATDVAEYAVCSLSDWSVYNRTFEMGGPEPFTPKQVVKIFEEMEHRPFELQFVSEQALRDQQEAATDPMEQSFVALQRSYAKGNEIHMGATASITHAHRITVEAYADRVLGKILVKAH